MTTSPACPPSKIAARRDRGGYTGDGQRKLRVTPVATRSYAEEWDKLDRLRQLVEQGEVTLRVADAYPAAAAAEAHRRLEAGGTRGRLVLTFD